MHSVSQIVFGFVDIPQIMHGVVDSFGSVGEVLELDPELSVLVLQLSNLEILLLEFEEEAVGLFLLLPEPQLILLDSASERLDSFGGLRGGGLEVADGLLLPMAHLLCYVIFMDGILNEYR